MSKAIREAMLGAMVALCNRIVASNAVADEMTRSANRLDGRPTAEIMRGIARRQRVKVLEMEGQLAALNDSYDKRFGT